MKIQDIIFKKYDNFTEQSNFSIKFKSFNSLLVHVLTANNPYFFHQKSHWETIIENALEADIQIGEYIALDISAILIRDPACQNIYEAIFFYKGFHALAWYRVSNYYWKLNNKLLARKINHFINSSLGIDIHPAASIGHSIFIDHGTGVVIGETTIMENYISMFHGVTLGGTGKESLGWRHPHIASHVLLSSHCSISGNIKINVGTRVAASSVVLDTIPEFVTVAGIPAKIVRHNSPHNTEYKWNFKWYEE